MKLYKIEIENWKLKGKFNNMGINAWTPEEFEQLIFINKILCNELANYERKIDSK